MLCNMLKDPGHGLCSYCALAYAAEFALSILSRNINFFVIYLFYFTSVDNVSARVTVTILFSKTKVNDEKFVTVSPDAHDEVVWLDVSVDYPLFMNLFNSLDLIILFFLKLLN